MKLRVLSDLHLECYESPWMANIRDDIGCDIVVLAGDIHTGTRGIEWAAATFREPVIYVMGNHEFYGHDLTDLLPRARQIAAESGVHLLERESVRVAGQRFLGCTLWSGLDSGPEPRDDVKGDIHGAVADFGAIEIDGQPLTPQTMVEQYDHSVGWLCEQLTPSDPVVVVTHFAPTLRVMDMRHSQDDRLNPYFYNDLDSLMGRAIPVWVHGHTHLSSQITVGRQADGTRVVSNQLGYPNEDTGFGVDFTIEA